MGVTASPASSNLGSVIMQREIAAVRAVVGGLAFLSFLFLSARARGFPLREGRLLQGLHNFHDHEVLPVRCCSPDWRLNSPLSSLCPHFGQREIGAELFVLFFLCAGALLSCSCAWCVCRPAACCQLPALCGLLPPAASCYCFFAGCCSLLTAAWSLLSATSCCCCFAGSCSQLPVARCSLVAAQHIERNQR